MTSNSVTQTVITDFPPISYISLIGFPYLPQSSYNNILEFRPEIGKSFNPLLTTTLVNLPSDFYVAPTIATISPPVVSSYSYIIGSGT